MPGIKERMNIFIRRVAKDRTYSSDTGTATPENLKIAALMNFIDFIDWLPFEIVSCTFLWKSVRHVSRGLLSVDYWYRSWPSWGIWTYVNFICCSDLLYLPKMVSNIEHGSKHDIYKDIFCKSDDLPPCVIFPPCHFTQHPIPMSPPRRIKQIELRISLK